MSPKPTGVLGFFPPLFSLFQEQLLGVLKVLNHWHPLPAHLPQWQLCSSEGFGDLRASRSQLVLAKAAAPLSSVWVFLGGCCGSVRTRSQPWQRAGEEEGAGVAAAWLYAFNYPSAAQHSVAVKINQRKREVLAAPGLPAGTEQGAGPGGDEREWQQG